MPWEQVKDWTIGMLAVASLAAAFIVLIRRSWPRNHRQETDAIRAEESRCLAEVVENNTRAIEQLSTLFQINFAEQEAKLDEVVDFVRRGKK